MRYLGGETLHATIWEQAAAYLFHLTKNHPFVDGNKRAGLACCLVFLRLNEHRIRATDDEGPNGLVRFEPLGEATTLVTVEMSYEPEGLKEQLGAKIGLDSRQVKEDLGRYKELVETMGSETGAWRGEVHSGERQA